jgi:hypothetical protein
MDTDRADFVFTVSRDVVRAMTTPLLIAPDDVPAHPYKVADRLQVDVSPPRTRQCGACAGVRPTAG